MLKSMNIRFKKRTLGKPWLTLKGIRPAGPACLPFPIGSWVINPKCQPYWPPQQTTEESRLFAALR